MKNRAEKVSQLENENKSLSSTAQQKKETDQSLPLDSTRSNQKTEKL